MGNNRSHCGDRASPCTIKWCNEKTSRIEKTTSQSLKSLSLNLLGIYLEWFSVLQSANMTWSTIISIGVIEGITYD